MYNFLKLNASKEETASFYKLKNSIYNDKENGFYVHAPKKECKNPNQIKRIVNYVCRYASHPAMSESRILKYDNVIKMVYYYYDPHEDDAVIDEFDKVGRQYVSESVFDFIAKLIIHIPEQGVHTTRYYGFYANHSSLNIEVQPKLYKSYEINKMKSNLDYRQRL
ncbi:MAG: transposase [Roseburia sp.]|nr:transposase [Anaeroplasma bactoclasticum]MCM1196559.1 transposase [Roseburia sp.]MCM1557592.1 transposase [Anaeroplasma bactoclasticum]